MKHKVKHIHFVGIGGAGMSGIAEVLLHLGYRISGSDMADNAAMQRLIAAGAFIHSSHVAEHVAGADVVVTSTAIKDDNPEVVSAIERQIPVISRAMMLAELMRFKHGIAVAGTHGKTTTTSLCASVLAAAGLDPTFVIGGKLLAAGTNAQLGSGDYLVAEADESDASFLCLSPVIATVTNIDADHMDTYGHDFDRLKQTFIDFLHRLPFYGRAILCIDDPNVREIWPQIQKPVVTYGLSGDANIRAANIRAIAGQMHFDVMVNNKCQQLQFQVRLNLPGQHNVLNALAVIAVSLECDIGEKAIQQGLINFSGVGRRFQSYGDISLAGGGSFTLIDDYGHHPTEMAATIEAARGAFPDKRIVLAFQPHRYTRVRDLFEDFVQVLSKVDALILSEVYAAGEAPIIAADGRALARAVRVAGKVEPVFVEDINDFPASVHSLAQPGDIVITMGAGSIGSIPGKLAIHASKQ